MSNSTEKPIIFLAFANDKQDSGAGFLRGLTVERNGIRDALMAAEDLGWCQVVVEPDVTIDRIFDIFQRKEYRDRIAIFHYGGHADSYELLLESQTGESVVANSEGLVSFLAKQGGLQMVFLNGCCSAQQAQDLVKGGIPAVVGTATTINDGLATGLAVRFYKGLAAGNPFERAWTDGIDQIKTEKRVGLTRGIGLEEEEKDPDQLPWDIYYGEDADLVKGWNLPDAVQNPLFGLELPKNYYRRLPITPFPGLQPYQKAEAALFFGRGAEIRALHTHIKGPQPIVLFTGKAGVGKSSLLEAGLLPRIERDFKVKYVRRQVSGLSSTLTSVFQELSEEYGLPPAEPAGLADLQAKITELQAALSESTGFTRQVLESELQKLIGRTGEAIVIQDQWLRIEEKAGRPLLLLLDQVDEALPSQPATEKEPPAEWISFLHLLNGIFNQGNQHPQGKLLLSYRDEYHRPIRESLQLDGLPYVEYFLPPLGRKGVMETVANISRHPATLRHYRLQVETYEDNNLPGVIADDLLEGKGSPVAPILQSLLLEMWNASIRANANAPQFTVQQYQRLKQTGTVMSNFFAQQISKIKTQHQAALASGLALDMLYRHVTPLSAAKNLSQEEFTALYGDRQNLSTALLEQFKDLYLLTHIQSGGSKLAHNLLAPVAVREYSISMKPGQQATRILNSKIDEFRTDKQSIWLNEADLEIVEMGKEGMPILNADEESLLQLSRERKIKREKDQRRNQLIRKFLAGVILIFAVLAGWQWWVSQQNYKESRSNELAFIANEVFKTDNTKAFYIAGKAYAFKASKPPELSTKTLTEVFHSQENYPFYAAVYPHVESNVNTAVFSPDGQLVITASEDGMAKLWKTDGSLMHTFKHRREVNTAAFSPNGKQILTLSDDREMVRLWEMDGTLIDSIKNENDTLELGLAKFSTDGIRILKTYTNSDDQPFQNLLDSLWQDNRYVITAPGNHRILLITFEDIARLYDGDGNVIQDSLANQLVHGAFSLDGKKLLTVSYPEAKESVVRCWDEQGKLLYEFRYPGELKRATFSPDGQQILTAANDYTAKRWDFSHPIVHRLPKHGSAVNSAAFSPDGTRMLTASRDKMVRLWDADGNLISSLEQEGPVNSAIFSPDGRDILVCSEQNTASLWIPDASKVVTLPHTQEVNQAIFSPDGSQILTLAFDSIQLWTADGTPSRTLAHPYEVNTAVFSPDGKQVLSVSTWENLATLWMANGDSIRFSHPGGEIYSAHFSPDGNQVLTTSGDGTARLWSSTGDSLTTFAHDEAVRIAAFSPDGKRILTAGKMIKIWDKEGNLLDSLSHKENVNAIAFSPDGQQILSASVDHTASLWNFKGELLAQFDKHEFQVNTAVFSPDGKRIITASDDGYAIVWWTPRTIYEWISTAPVYQLSKLEEALYKVRE